MNNINAIGITSGGLDSMLAALVLKRQGLNVNLVCFTTPFFSPHNAIRLASSVELPLKVADITEEHLAMLRHPRYGYGSHMNPCIDCHALMIRKAGEMMKEEPAHFVFTGEVLGQRPFSQNRQALRTVARESGLNDLLLRPLSAKLLDITVPEKEGWVDRERLFDISGRSRKRQMALADEVGFTDYPSPAGGCLLTEKVFSARLKDLFRHEPNFQVRDIHLLKLGRHFRLNAHVKLVVGRNKGENETLRSIVLPEDDVLTCLNYAGPTAIVPAGMTPDLHHLAASICASYSDAPTKRLVQVSIARNQWRRIIIVLGIPRKDMGPWLI